MYDLTNFTLKDMTTCGAALRDVGQDATSMEAVANQILGYLYDHLVDETGQRSSVMLRFFITYPYHKLDTSLQQHIQGVLNQPSPDPELRCQTLLATVGVKPAWNDRNQSEFYKCLPLTAEIVQINPMYAQFSKAFGIAMDKLVTPDPGLIVELTQRTFNVFHVPDAVGSDYIPDQAEFVIPYDIHSVLGFFGMLPSGNLFTVLLFSKAFIPRETTEYFKTLALNVKMAVLPFDDNVVFASDEAVTLGDPMSDQKTLIQQRSLAASLQQLVEVQERVVIEQSERIEQVLAELRAQTTRLADTNRALESKVAENEKLRQQAAETAVLEERNRLARDLHDSVTQSLYSLTLFAEAGQRSVNTGHLDRVNTYLSQLGETAQQALKEMRLLVYELRPLALEQAGLVGALQQRLDAVEGRAGVEAKLQVNDLLNLPPNVEEGLYRIAQEALNNVLKHAATNTVTVQITADEIAVVLTISDEGKGFDSATIDDEGGMGLMNMHERVEKLGGHLKIDSQPNQGTTITVKLKPTWEK